MEQLKIILNINNEIGDFPGHNEEDSEEEENDRLKTLYEIKGNYVFTPDNYLKMVLVLLRIRANIPVILMGETGCGKTALIEKLSEMLNNGDKNQLKKLNIYSGTNNHDIIQFLEKEVIPQAEHLQIIERERAEQFQRDDFIYYEKKIWVFFDGINNCNSIGLITEIMCKHSYQGKILPSNIAFIGACNPYRYKKEKIKENPGLKILYAKKDIEENIKDLKERDIFNTYSFRDELVYKVNPLPYTLLNFVLYFGNLEENVEKEYIKEMIRNNLEKTFNQYKERENLNEEDFKRIHNLAIDMINWK